MTTAKRKVSAAQRKATDKYLEKFDEMRVGFLSVKKAVSRPTQRPRRKA